MPTVADYDERIAASEAMTRWLRRQRKSLVMSTKAKLQHKDPEWTANLRKARREAHADPEKLEIEREKKRKAALAQQERNRPPMTKEQRAAYDRYRTGKRMSREQALSLVLANKFPISRNGGYDERH